PAFDPHRPAILRALLAAGARPLGRNRTGESALSIALFEGNRPLVFQLLAAGARVQPIEGASECVLDYVPFDRPDLAQLLIDYGADVDARDAESRTPLMHFADLGATEIVKLLIAAHAEVNARDRFGNTALSCARYGGNKHYGEIME